MQPFSEVWLIFEVSLATVLFFYLAAPYVTLTRVASLAFLRPNL